jgi:hypothetical protein
VNSLSLSEMIFNGKPFSQYQLSKKMTAKSLAVILQRVGMIWMSELRRLVIDRMQLNLWSIGSGPMKSIATLSPCASRIGRGCGGPDGLVSVLKSGPVQFFGSKRGQPGPDQLH